MKTKGLKPLSDSLKWMGLISLMVLTGCSGKDAPVEKQGKAPDDYEYEFRPEPHQPGYIKKLNEWIEKHKRRKHPLEEPVLLPEFEPDLNHKGEAFEGIFLDSTIPDSMYRGLAKDLMSIRHLTFADPDGKLQALLKLPDVRGETLLNWLRERLQFVLGGAFAEKYRRLELPWNEAEERDRKYPLRPALMTNVSTDEFLANKQWVEEVNPTSWFWQTLYEVPGYPGPVRVLSPRVGIAQLGASLPDPHWTVWPQTESRERIAVLFHEARHADGNSVSGTLGFNHTTCKQGQGSGPKSNDCDIYSNGAYVVGGYILRALALTCDQCVRREQMLTLAEGYIQQVQPEAEEGDDTPEPPLVDPNPEPQEAREMSPDDWIEHNGLSLRLGHYNY